jgi:A/G-specific adenine glycosylase
MSSTTSSKAKTAFKRAVLSYYRRQGRHTLPWRLTNNPYYILVSELMLQQTQVDRVIPKYTAFIEAFPSIDTLAQASLKDVLKLWQGLGYNRRAKFLHEIAVMILQQGGTFPATYSELRQLPGVGPYTAGAILAFAFEVAHPVIETNIRTVYIHHFFRDKNGVSDAELLDLVTETLPKKQVREWYYALMDYGVFLKKEHNNPSRRSRHHHVQKKFIGSDRQIRGAIIRALSQKRHTNTSLQVALGELDGERISIQLKTLVAEGLVAEKGRFYELPT